MDCPPTCYGDGWSRQGRKKECHLCLVGQLGPRVHRESGASISAKSPGLQLNVSVCAQCLPAEALVTGLAKIPGLRVSCVFIMPPSPGITEVLLHDANSLNCGQ